MAQRVAGISRPAQRLLPLGGLLLAFLATIVAVRAWRGERFLAEGLAAQRQGYFDAATAAYRVATGFGNADAAAARARLELLRHDWIGSGASVREAMALAPMRGYPHVLQAELDLDAPGPWDGAREARVRESCMVAAGLEPHRVSIERECEAISRRLAAGRRHD